MRDTIEIMDGIATLEANLDDAVPHAALEKTGYGALPRVKPEQNNKSDQPEGQGLIAMCKRTDRVPRHQSKNDGENQQQEKGQTPQLALSLFKLLQAVRNSGSATQARRRALGRVRK